MTKKIKIKINNYDNKWKEALELLKWYINDEKVYKQFKREVLKENTEIMNENYIFSKDNLYINFDKFESGEFNICLITGLSGSGKSTLGKKLSSEYKAEYVELDDFQEIKNIPEYGYSTPLREYMNKHKDIYNRIMNDEYDFNSKEAHDTLRDFVKFTISYCIKDKKNKYVIEGVQIYSHGDTKQIKGKPTVLIGKSVLKSFLQRMKRNKENNLMTE